MGSARSAAADTPWMGRKRKHSLPHDGRQPSELKHVPGDKEQRVKQLLLLARVVAPRKEDDHERDRAEHGENEIRDVEGRFPEPLRYEVMSDRQVPRQCEERAYSAKRHKAYGDLQNHRSVDDKLEDVK